MPSVLEQNAVYLQSGNPYTEDVATLHVPGQLGARFTMQHPTSRASGAPVPRTKGFVQVRVDPAAAAAPKVGQPAYWSDRGNYVVTTAGGTTLNQVAGVFNNAATRGNYTILQTKGPCLVRASDANVTAAVAGADILVGGAADLGVLVAAGTAPGTRVLGVVSAPKLTDTTGGTGNHRIQVDLDVPENY
jgi:Uncharacterized conserved protein (DUF2190)